MLKTSKKFIIALSLICISVTFTYSLVYAGWSPPEELPVAVNAGGGNTEDPFYHISSDGREFIYCSSNSSTAYDDLYVAEKIGGVWQPRQSLNILNSSYRDKTPSLTADGNELYFWSQRPAESQDDIWVSQSDGNGNWLSPTRVINNESDELKKISSNYRDITSAISGDGLTIYFASDRPGSLGKHDLYYATRDCRTCPWSAAENITVINSSEHDNFPAVSSDNLTLYFSRTNPVGPYDIYSSTRNCVQCPWQPPVKFTLSTDEAGERSPSITPDGKTLYFSYYYNSREHIWMTKQDADDDGYDYDQDCDDNDASINPEAPEICDGKDNDCDSVIPPEENDSDDDGYMICENDCDDSDAGVNPNSYELPGNVVDENCDGSLGACDPNEYWKNHGQFVRCVAHETDALIEQGILTEEEGDALISSAAQSDVGKK